MQVYLVTYKPDARPSRPLLKDEEEGQKYALKFMNRHLHDCDKLFRHEVDIMQSLEDDGICRCDVGDERMLWITSLFLVSIYPSTPATVTSPPGRLRSATETEMFECISLRIVKNSIHVYTAPPHM